MLKAVEEGELVDKASRTVCEKPFDLPPPSYCPRSYMRVYLNTTTHFHGLSSGVGVEATL